MNSALYIIYVLLFSAIYNVRMLRQTGRLAKLPTRCGRMATIGDKITNGKDANLGQFPFMALLGYTKNVAKIDLVQFLCGGSIINEEHILTAAHCFTNKSLLSFVRLGELDLNTQIDCSKNGDFEQCGDPYLDIPIEKNIIHTHYNPNNFKNDIALVKLARKVSFTEYIQPICLPLDNNNLIKPILMVSGWGKTITNAIGGSSKLQFAMVTSWSKRECENVLTPEVRPLQETQLCANGIKGQDACRGDSGGPLFVVEGVDYVATYFQVGIVSFGATSSCGNSELPSVYTRVDKHVDWIIANI